MTFEVLIESYVLDYFKKDSEQHQLHYFLTNQLPVYLTQLPAKIKPVHGKLNHLYELKVRVGRDFYRVAFLRDTDKIQVVYITETLLKRKFDQEVNRFLIKRKT